MVMFVCKDAQTVLNRTKFFLKIKYVIKFITFNSNHELSYKNKWIRFKKKSKTTNARSINLFQNEKLQ